MGFKTWLNDSLDCLGVCCYVLLFLSNLNILSLCLLASLDKGLDILLIFSRKQLLVSLILCIVLFVSILFMLELTLIISCLLLPMSEPASFSCAVKLVGWDLSTFVNRLYKCYELSSYCCFQCVQKVWVWWAFIFIEF